MWFPAKCFVAKIFIAPTLNNTKLKLNYDKQESIKPIKYELWQQEIKNITILDYRFAAENFDLF